MNTNYEAPHYAVFSKPPVTSSLFYPNILLSTLKNLHLIRLFKEEYILIRSLSPYSRPKTTSTCIILTDPFPILRLTMHARVFHFYSFVVTALLDIQVIAEVLFLLLPATKLPS
jgi:hypothetical protein